MQGFDYEKLEKVSKAISVVKRDSFALIGPNPNEMIQLDGNIYAANTSAILPTKKYGPQKNALILIDGKGDEGSITDPTFTLSMDLTDENLS